MPYTEWCSSGKDSEESGGEVAEDEDEAEEPPDPQPYSGKCVAVVVRAAPAQESPQLSDSRRSTQ